MNRRCAAALGAAFVLTAGFAAAVPTPTANASPSCEPGQIKFIEKHSGRVTCMECPAGTTPLPSGWCQRIGTTPAPSAPSSTSAPRSGGVAA